MKYVFGNHYGRYDLFKILFDAIVTDKEYLISIRKMMNDEDVIKEQLCCSFHDDYNKILENVEITFLDEVLEISREELYQLLIIGIKKYLLMYSEDVEELKKILDDLLDKCRNLTERIPEDFYLTS
jgi:hypothetical protein